ncbi:MAG TPA: EAL domain-containing protein [Rhodopseudomonas sp.]|uniref:bifunctional diguanylate cyclase/phosphodiesterase n=1 Tax=Rhodopseudomonas sp. TaxID=1078 RepID=UPI002ED7F8BE
MHQVYICLTAQHDLRLLALTATICLFVSTVSIGLFNHCRTVRGRGRLLWLGITAIAAGFGIWATHFIGMLAFDRSGLATYDVGATILSLLLAILITGVGLGVTLRGRTTAARATGGAIIGLGIAAMHYTGIQSLDATEPIVWSPAGVLASVTLGVSFASLAMVAIGPRQNIRRALAAACLLAVAVLALHFSAMAAILVLPPADSGAAALSSATMALGVAGVALAVFAICLLAAISDSHAHTLLSRQRMLLDVALENMPQALCMFDAEGRAAVFNRRFAKMAMLPMKSLRGISLLEIFERRKAIGDFKGDPKAVYSETLAIIRAGKPSIKIDENSTSGRVVRITEQPLSGGGWVATLEDITEWRQAQDQIAHLAHHDPLTNLPNRAKFHEALQRVLTSSRSGDRFAVLYVDLDHFKEINDSLGHVIGDGVLVEMARRLAHCVRDGDTVARIGGDEFAIVQIGLHKQDSDAAALASRIVETIAVPFEIQGRLLRLGTSVGITVAPGGGGDAEQLIKEADMALYRAKAEGRGTYRFFEIGMDAHAQARRLLSADLRHAIIRAEFTVDYQAVHDVAADRITCFEALLRWNHPQRGVMLPGLFLRLAEENGLIVPIGDWVLRTACADAARWHTDARIAVNLSPAQFRHPDLVRAVAAALAESGLPAPRLELEIAESVFLHDSTATLVTLRALQALGVRIAMDHFGAGYSLLGYLRNFAFDQIKIDHSLVQEIGHRDDAGTLVRAITGFGKSLGVATSATGVETGEQLALLRREGCNEVQGPLFGPPQTAREVEQFFAARRGLGVA